MSVDESTYDPRGYSVPGGSPPMGDHPISWCQPYDGGRSFYTALGHKGVYWDEPVRAQGSFVTIAPLPGLYSG